MSNKYKLAFDGPEHDIGETVIVRGQSRLILSYSCEVFVANRGGKRLITQREWQYTVSGDDCENVFYESELGAVYQ